ncbi:MAG: ABC transporter permease [Clostridia bacterium]|nr:ABC transporter permease [Clostridia bacterium]
MKNNKLLLNARRLIFRNATLIFIVALAIFVFIKMPLFFTKTSLLNLCSQASVFGIVAIGLTMIILMGHIDISTGAQVYLCGVIGVRMFYATQSLAAAITVSILVGMLVGTINGYLIGKVGIPDMVLTMSTQFICRGIGNLIIGVDAVINVSDPVFQSIGQGKTLSVPNCTWFFILVFFLGWILLKKTKFGRYIYAIGNDADALNAAGVNVLAVKMGAYIITGFLCGLAGLINVSRLGGSTFGLAVGMEFTCIAACVAGGASLYGGVGKMPGTLLGIVVIASVNQLLRLFNVSNFLYDLVWGIVVLLTVSMDVLKHHQIKYEKDNGYLYPGSGKSIVLLTNMFGLSK